MNLLSGLVVGQDDGIAGDILGLLHQIDECSDASRVVGHLIENGADIACGLGDDSADFAHAVQAFSGQVELCHEHSKASFVCAIFGGGGH